MGVTGLRSAAEIVVEGRVQGVGYRDYVQRKGLSLGLAGYVMNMKNGQRIEVLLNRGFADEWVPGTVLDAREKKIQLDEDVPGLPRVVSDSDIAEWRRAPDNFGR